MYPWFSRQVAINDREKLQRNLIPQGLGYGAATQPLNEATEMLMQKNICWHTKIFFYYVL